MFLFVKHGYVYIIEFGKEHTMYTCKYCGKTFGEETHYIRSKRYNAYFCKPECAIAFIKDEIAKDPDQYELPIERGSTI